MAVTIAGAALFAASSIGLAAPTPAPAKLPGIEEKTAGMQKIDGFVPLYWDSATDTVWLEIGRLGEELLYFNGNRTGVGGKLDRGASGTGWVVRFERVGTKVLLKEVNYTRSAMSGDPFQQAAVAESFAASTLWGFKAEAQSGSRVLVNATDFFLRDAQNTAQQLGPGLRVDPSRSAIELARTRGFPRNTEVEVALTFIEKADAGLTLYQHHSFVALPDPGYQQRRLDPRAGFFDFRYYDYVSPIDQPVQQAFLSRHRLKKKDPAAALSEPVKPIVYYVDRGIPEPIRSAVMEGASWWNQAFEAAGYKNAFQVKLLPEDADPMDLRYNLIQWVYRLNRGWSYGQGVADPRTGEILAGRVTLGALRIRQDFLIAQGLLLPYGEDAGKAEQAKQMALARIRQLAAHEVGHSLGLQHNYIASTSGRASVMDYPHPLVKLAADGEIDLSDAYAKGIGEWDKVAIEYGYREFPKGTDEAGALERILQQARARNLVFFTDADARPPGSAHPRVNLWDNGVDAVAELKRVMKVRRAALDRFDERAIPKGEPMAGLEYVLVPLYLHHRYQVEAAIKTIGGQYYEYAVRGDGLAPVRPVPAKEQTAALEAVLETLNPAELTLPPKVLALIPPDPGTLKQREGFARNTGLVFDALSPAAASADMVVQVLLDPARAARLVQQHALDGAQPGLESMLDRLIAATFDGTAGNGYEAEIARAIQPVVVARLISLATSAPMPQVRAITRARLDALIARPLPQGANEADRAARALMSADIKHFMEQPYDPARIPAAPVAPPGSPIGHQQYSWIMDDCGG